MSPQQEVFGALEQAMGFRPTMPGTCKVWGKVANELVAGGATGEAILYAAGQWPRKFPKATLTVTALVKHFDLLTADLKPRVSTETAEQRARQLGWGE